MLVSHCDGSHFTLPLCIITLHIGPMKKILDTLDPKLFKRVKWLKPKDVVRINDGSLTVSFHVSYAGTTGGYFPRYGANRYVATLARRCVIEPVSHNLFRYLLAWLRSLKPPGWTPTLPNNRVVIYYSRVVRHHK